MTKQTLIHTVAATFNGAKAKIAGGAALLMGSAVAHAQEATGAAAAFSELESQAAEMAGYAWPVVVGVVGSLLAIGVFKKFANKAT
ncbi:major coat protein [Halomonas sp. KO116]|uniref:major coat protein n=1 Tax=Halomonas sp. KO116 TaxID=1504981 RepID=UPI0004E419AC|nr:major coat protein [Halomonas sp. KO116]AJY52132.1 coat B protein [Halomonas sp. KO116]